MRILTVVNPRSGLGDSGLGTFATLAGARGADVTLRYLTDQRTLAEILADVRNFDRVVAAGGDGTVASVCYELRDSGTPIMVYPAGTGNLLAQNLKMSIEPTVLADTAISGAAVPVDLGELEYGPADDSRTCGFLGIAGAGFDAKMMESATPLKQTMGAAAYIFGAISQIAPGQSEFELKLDGKLVSTKGMAVMVMNFGRLFFDLPLVPGASPSDGSFEVVVLRGRNVAELAPALMGSMMERLGLNADRLPGIDTYTASEIEVSAYPPLPMQYDGEVLSALTPFKARVLPGATTLVLPPDSPFAPA